MTNREREFASLGIDPAEGIDFADALVVPSTGREIRRVGLGWEAQPWCDNYYRIFADLLDAVRFATPPAHGGVKEPSRFADERALPIRPVE
jgi:hypothetical protein